MVLCTAKQKGGGGGEEEARGFSTVRGASQNGDGRVEHVEAAFAIMRLTAQPGNKICILYYLGVQMSMWGE